ncbi:DUF1707 domain-containing protein [Micromonospora sp. NPDC023956]|uniref:DUF1707 SHOCT-like domain-containing protein n=1 Tax=Micromonospora sp. NPDC023956 TaxID=3155722 RepID=UPI0033E5C097
MSVVHLGERVGTRQRNAVAELLARALAEGYLDLAEFDRRTVATHRAVTVGDLSPQLRDLPRQFQWLPTPPVVAPPRRSHDESMAAVALSLSVASLPTAFCAGLGGLLAVTGVILGALALRTGGRQTVGVAAVVIGLVGTVLSLGLLAVAALI